MRYKICAIRDRAADTYGQPLFFNSIGAAIRAFGDEVNREAENNNIYKHPDDFDLYTLGDYDDDTGKFDTFGPQQIAIGKDLKR